MAEATHWTFKRLEPVSDQDLLEAAWSDVRSVTKRNTALSTGSTVSTPRRARFASECPRCMKQIIIDDEIRWHRDFGGYVHARCKTKPDPVERGRPETGLTIAKMSRSGPARLLSVCAECHLEHAGECP